MPRRPRQIPISGAQQGTPLSQSVINRFYNLAADGASLNLSSPHPPAMIRRDLSSGARQFYPLGFNSRAVQRADPAVSAASANEVASANEEEFDLHEQIFSILSTSESPSEHSAQSLTPRPAPQRVGGTFRVEYPLRFNEGFSPPEASTGAPPNPTRGNEQNVMADSAERHLQEEQRARDGSTPPPPRNSTAPWPSRDFESLVDETRWNLAESQRNRRREAEEAQAERIPSIIQDLARSTYPVPVLRERFESPKGKEGFIKGVAGIPLKKFKKHVIGGDSGKPLEGIYKKKWE